MMQSSEAEDGVKVERGAALLESLCVFANDPVHARLYPFPNTLLSTP